MPIAGRAADLAYMLTASGVPVTLGGASTSGLVRAADEELLRDSGSPVALVGRAIVVTIARDSLPGLASDAEVIVTAGPLVGAYKADRILGESDGAAVRFLAYPTEAVSAPDFWARGSELLTWALREPGAAAGPVFDLSTIEAGPILVLEAELAEAGTDPVLNVTVLTCATEDGTFEDSGYAFEPISEDGGFRALALDLGAIERYIQLVPAITGTDSPAFRCGAGALDVAVPR